MCLLEDGTLITVSGNEIRAWDSNSNFVDVKTRQVSVFINDFTVTYYGNVKMI